MPKHPEPPKHVVRITEYEVDPRDIDDMLRGKRRSRPRKPVLVKHHDMSAENLEQFLRRIGVDPKTREPKT